MAADFGGVTADYYARYRRGYPSTAVDAIAGAFGLGPDDTAVDLGCGTGQLTLALAARVGAVLGVDPEPDMLRLARQAGRDAGVANVEWASGTDADLTALVRGRPALGAVTMALAVHWMDRDRLFPAIRPLLRPGGGIAVVTNGTPMWLQDADWSRALRGCLSELIGRPVDDACQTDEAGRRANREALRAAGYRVSASIVEYRADLTVERVVGGMFSAMPVGRLAPGEREAWAARIRAAVRPYVPLTEHVRVHMQFGHT
jgi:SAM-dependent methyltransferase